MSFSETTDSSNEQSIKFETQIPLLYLSDSNIDDMISLLMLLNNDSIKLIGISITPSDCEEEIGIEATSKILYLTGKKIPFCMGKEKGIHNFSQSQKDDARNGIFLPDFLSIEEEKIKEIKKNLLSNKEPIDFIYEKIKENDKVNILITGPPIQLTETIKKYKNIKEKIGKICWMGGVIDIEGNTLNKRSEFNCAWNPYSSSELFNSKMEIYLFPLNATNQVLVNREFLEQLSKQKNYQISYLTSQLLATVFFMDYTGGNDNYYCWDMLATSFFGCKDLCSFKEMELDVIKEGDEDGKIIKVKNSGNWIFVADKVNVGNFRNFFFNSLKFNFWDYNNVKG